MSQFYFLMHPAQREIYLAELINTDSSQFNIGGRIVLKGELDVKKLHQAVASLPQFFDSCKMRFDFSEAETVYKYAADFSQTELIEVDFSKQGAAEAKAWVRYKFNAPFRLKYDTIPFEYYLVKISDNEHWLVMKYHHLINDGFGFIVSIEHIANKYSALVKGEIFSPVYPAYHSEIIRANEFYSSAYYAQNHNYWQEKISEKPQKILAKKYPLHNLYGEISDTYSVDLAENERQLLSEITNTCKAGLQQLTIAALIIYFGNISPVEDLVFGIPVHKRGSKQLRNTVGMFSGALPFTGKYNADQTLADLLSDITATQKQDYRHYNYQVGDLNRSLLINSSEDQLFDVLVNYEPLDLKMAFGDDIQAQLIRLESYDDRNPLQICWRDYSSKQPLQLQIHFCHAYFTHQEVELLGERLLHIIKNFCAAFDKPLKSISVLPIYEASQLRLFSGSYSGHSEGESIISLFRETVARYGEEVALLFGEAAMSYQELNDRSDGIRDILQGRGLVKGSLVGVCMDRGMEMIVSVLGILKAGAAYVPVDPGYPEERIAYILKDAGCSIVLTERGLSSRLSGVEAALLYAWDELNKKTSETDKASKDTIVVSPGDLAYVIYTSGSTGQPKGVMVEHGGVVNLAQSQAAALALQPGMRTLQFASLGFDASCYEIFNTLLSAGCLVLCAKETLLSSAAFTQLIDEQEVALAVLPPSFQQTLTYIPATLRTIVSAGEPLNGPTAIALQLQGVRVINAYGPTEATVCATLTDSPLSGDGTVTIGHPIRNVIIEIMSAHGRRVPIGISGELWIGGAGVSRGYLNREELTAEKFVQGEDGRRYYRTGDMGRWLSDGNIEYLGRTDDQVKIRGYRIEPGEIENVLLQSGLLKQAVVLALADKEGNKRLTGYVSTAGALDRQGLESYLGSRLPEYMIPRVWISVSEMPLTAHGKIDKRALAELSCGEDEVRVYTAPATATEAQLAAIWAVLLGIEKVSREDNFFERGGHSLLAMRLVSQLQRENGLELSIRDVFSYPRLSELAQQVRKGGGSGVIIGGRRPSRIPLSYSQERLWFIDKLEGSVQYHIPAVLHLSGKPDVIALERSIRAIVDRHEVLRTVIREEEGLGYQEIKPAGQWQLKQISHASGAVSAYIREQLKKPFDLSTDDMLRAALIDTGEGEYILMLEMHHIASDGWSMSILVNELFSFYESYRHGHAISLPLPGVQYADYAIWQRAHPSGAQLEQKLGYWTEQLRGVSTLQLPTDRPRPAVQSSRGGQYRFIIAPEQASGLSALSLEQGATLYMTLLSVFNILLYRYSGQQDICVGTSVANRDQHEVSGLIGFFVNMLAIRSNVSGGLSFKELLESVKQTTLSAYEHQDVPFEKVVDAVVKERDLSWSPLFQVLFELQNAPAIPGLQLGEISMTAAELSEHTAKFDISLNMQESAQGISARIEYNTDLYDQATIAAMSAHFLRLTAAILENPDARIGSLSILDESELSQLESFNATGAGYPAGQNIITLFAEQVKARPDATAIVFGEEEVTYRELNERANQIAHFLIGQNIKAESMVPVCMQRDIGMVATIIGILKAGGAYVPIDPEYPADRISYMLADTRATLVLGNVPAEAGITAYDPESDLIAAQSKTDPATDILSGQMAYVIYTSGSTGQPKGVMVEHGSLLNYLVNENTRYIDTNTDKSGSYIYLSYTFDASLTALFMPLINGKQAVIAAEQQLKVFQDPNFLRYAPYDFIKITPAHIGLLQQTVADISSLTDKLVIGGDVLRLNYFDQYIESKTNGFIINEYGPTEATVGCSTYSFKLLNNTENECSSISIGKPIANTKMYILTDDQQLQPVGVPGEICIGGDGLARGYLNREELTKEKFIANPFSKEPGSRLYRTGDIGRWRTDGNIEYLGRKDEQVKIRGYRIELGEIESVLLASGLVDQSVVLAIPDTEGNKYLTGYVVMEGLLDKQVLESYLQERLPEYMLPRVWVKVDNIPLTSNGKTDKRALAAIAANEQVPDLYVAPRNAIETQLAAIWQGLLEIDKIGITDNFFDLGGHSLLAIRMVAHIENIFSISIPISAVFDLPSINLLSQYISIGMHNKPDSEKQGYKVVDL